MLKQKTIQNDLEYLRQISKPIDFKKDPVLDYFKQLEEFCVADNAAMALASIQTGIPYQMIYLKKTDFNRLDEEDYNERRVLINPKIIESYGLTEFWEGCTSCTTATGWLTALVERPYRIIVEYYDLEANKHRETFEGNIATIICHEYDHLYGILHIDKAKKVLELTDDEKKELRKREPYKIIRKDGLFKNDTLKIENEDI